MCVNTPRIINQETFSFPIHNNVGRTLAFKANRTPRRTQYFEASKPRGRKYLYPEIKQDEFGYLITKNGSVIKSEITWNNMNVFRLQTEHKIHSVFRQKKNTFSTDCNQVHECINWDEVAMSEVYMCVCVCVVNGEGGGGILVCIYYVVTSFVHKLYSL